MLLLLLLLLLLTVSVHQQTLCCKQLDYVLYLSTTVLALD